MEILTSKSDSKNIRERPYLTRGYFEQRSEKISIRQLFENFKVTLTHALPDDTQEQVDQDDRPNYTSNYLLEEALEKVLTTPIENLAFSSSGPGDNYNRWFSRYTGVILLDGDIVSAKSSDANSKHAEYLKTSKLANNTDILEAVNKYPHLRNELNIRTKPESLLPYFDLDYCAKGLPWGSGTSNANLGEISMVDQAKRYGKLMQQYNFPLIGIYKGQPVIFEVSSLLELLKPFKNQMDMDEESQQYNQNKIQFNLKLPKILKPINYSQMLGMTKIRQLSKSSKSP